MNPLDWIIKFSELCAKPLLGYFGSPQMEIDKDNTLLGWSQKDRQQVALLLCLKFVNKSEKPFLLRSVEVEHREEVHGTGGKRMPTADRVAELPIQRTTAYPRFFRWRRHDEK
jgi:hypothetical protein